MNFHFIIFSLIYNNQNEINFFLNYDNNLYLLKFLLKIKYF